MRQSSLPGERKSAIDEMREHTAGLTHNCPFWLAFFAHRRNDMPFDGHSQNVKAVAMIDMLLDYYGLGVGDGKRSGEVRHLNLLQALQILRSEHKIQGDNTRKFLLRAASKPG